MSTWTPMDSPTGAAGGPQHHDAYAPSPFPGTIDGTIRETTPEPTGVGPAAGGSLRASDGDRDQVASLLDAAYAEGRLTHEEHDERLERVLAARTFDDLVPLTSDLVPLDPAPTTVSSSTPQFVVGTGANPEVDRMVAVFGGVERKGRWRVRARNQITAVFGGVDLDLREADFDAPVIELHVQACFGGVELKVPAGLTVRNETVNIFGGTEVKNIGEPVEGAPTLVIKGNVLFGGVSVKGPRPKLFGRGSARPGLTALDPRPEAHQRRNGCGH
ncbi:DUF1707 domain-containing protein [Microlunatus spumicola]|uniref:DUF1707 domain-containing protein n=1 Tax=Microlunatus spumicola TaxID=81499 RepID=UPI00195CCF10